MCIRDSFYANRLLEDGGFVAIDDANWPSIRKMISYVSKYPNYRIYNSCLLYTSRCV